MSGRTEKEIISDVLLMKQQGISVKAGSLLLTLYHEVYGKPLRTNCSVCIRDGFDNLISWANKRLRKQSTNNMAASKYRFKIEYNKQTLPIWYKGMKYIVNQHNLTDELAEIIKNIPKYAHVIEELPAQKHKITVDVLAPKEQVVIDEPESDSIEGEELEVVTASTSNEQPIDGDNAKPKRGRPSKK